MNFQHGIDQTTVTDSENSSRETISTEHKTVTPNTMKMTRPEDCSPTNKSIMIIKIGSEQKQRPGNPTLMSTYLRGADHRHVVFRCRITGIKNSLADGSGVVPVTRSQPMT